MQCLLMVTLLLQMPLQKSVDNTLSASLPSLSPGKYVSIALHMLQNSPSFTGDLNVDLFRLWMTSVL